MYAFGGPYTGRKTGMGKDTLSGVGELCWKRPTDAGVIEKSRLEGAMCTSCALKKGAGQL